jgi:predicted nuclease of predicted toxin-antitoxin system
MKFLADENMPRGVVAALRASGRDVIWIREAAPGSSDIEILARTAHDLRILLTFDKDFGELAFRSRLPAECGVVLLRVPTPRSEEAVDRLCKRIVARTDWAGRFSVIEAGRVRMRDLPAQS